MRCGRACSGFVSWDGGEKGLVVARNLLCQCVEMVKVLFGGGFDEGEAGDEADIISNSHSFLPFLLVSARFS